MAPEHDLPETRASAAAAVSPGPRIALIHALKESMEPIRLAFADVWPEAELMNLLDDSASVDRARERDLTPTMIERFLTLGRYARTAGAQGVLFTCSAFGPAIDAVASDLAPLPVHKPNAAMIADAVAHGGRVGLLASFAPTLSSMLTEFPAPTSVVPCYCAGALEALSGGDGPGHDRLAAQAAADQLGQCDVIVLSQFSLARAAQAVADRTGKPVLTTPHSAAGALRRAFA